MMGREERTMVKWKDDIVVTVTTDAGKKEAAVDLGGGLLVHVYLPETVERGDISVALRAAEAALTHDPETPKGDQIGGIISGMSPAEQSVGHAWKAYMESTRGANALELANLKSAVKALAASLRVN
jgi:hypothetical protein